MLKYLAFCLILKVAFWNNQSTILIWHSSYLYLIVNINKIIKNKQLNIYHYLFIFKIKLN